MKTSESIAAIAPALVKAQASFEPVLTDREGQLGNRKYKYASLGSIRSMVIPRLTANDMFLVQDPQTNESGKMWVQTRVIHKTGEWMEGGLIEFAMTDGDVKSLGSAITYICRYSLVAFFNIVIDFDDDGDMVTTKAKMTVDEVMEDLRKYTDPINRKSRLRELENVVNNRGELLAAMNKEWGNK